MKLTKPQGARLFVFLVSIAMTAVMSFGILLLRTGWRSDFLMLWLGDFLIGCCMSVPTGFTIVPLIKKWVDRVTSESG
jgi:hypothetical protein